MRRTMYSLLILLLPAVVMGAPMNNPSQWNDALGQSAQSRVRGSRIDQATGLAMGDITVRPGQNFEGAPTPDETAKLIVLDHLRHVKNSGLMSNSIAQVGYWQQVFWHAGRPDLYDVGKPVVEMALKAGLQPYFQGQSLSAEQFSDLAIKELTKSDLRSEEPADTAGEKFTLVH